VLWHLKQNGYADETIKGYSKRLKHLEQNTDINNPQTVRGYIARMNVSNAYKEAMVNAYIHYVEFYGLEWKKPIYKRSERLPNVPSTEQVNKIIANSGRKNSMIFSILRDTGLRPVELHRLTIRNINLEHGIIYPETAKGGSARALELKHSTLAMLKEYIAKKDPKTNERIFPTTKIMSHVWCRIRNRTAKKLQEPELKNYRLYDLRHYFATMLYHRTKLILLVKAKLGHRNIQNTLIYMHLVKFTEDEYNTATASTIEEACKLINVGYEYVTEMDDAKIFRKRK
jgi:integrase